MPNNSQPTAIKKKRNTREQMFDLKWFSSLYVSLPSVSLRLGGVTMRSDGERLMKLLGLSPVLSGADERRGRRAPPPQLPEELRDTKQGYPSSLGVY